MFMRISNFCHGNTEENKSKTKYNFHLSFKPRTLLAFNE